MVCTYTHRHRPTHAWTHTYVSRVSRAYGPNYRRWQTDGSNNSHFQPTQKYQKLGNVHWKQVGNTDFSHRQGTQTTRTYNQTRSDKGSKPIHRWRWQQWSTSWWLQTRQVCGELGTMGEKEGRHAHTTDTHRELRPRHTITFWSTFYDVRGHVGNRPWSLV